MNRYDVEFTASAAADFQRNCGWYAAQSSAAEAKWIAVIEAAIESLE